MESNSSSLFTLNDNKSENSSKYQSFDKGSSPSDISDWDIVASTVLPAKAMSAIYLLSEEKITYTVEEISLEESLNNAEPLTPEKITTAKTSTGSKANKPLRPELLCYAQNEVNDNIVKSQSTNNSPDSSYNDSVSLYRIYVPKSFSNLAIKKLSSSLDFN